MLTLEGTRTSNVMGAALAVLIAYPLLKAIYNIYFHPLSKVPGPASWSASRLPFAHAVIKGTIISDLENLHRRYGPVLRISPDDVTFSHPDAQIDMLQGRLNHQQFLKDPIWWARGGQPPLTSLIDPSAHAHVRKQLAPAFTARALRAQEPIIQRYANLLVERLCEMVSAASDGVSICESAEVDMVPWFNFTTFDIFGDLGFGESFQCLQNSAYHPWISRIFNNVKLNGFVAMARYYPWVDFVLLRCIPSSLTKMAADHAQQIADKVQRRLNWELERPDIMSYMIDSEVNDNHSSPSSLSIGEINANFRVIITAASETTATLLSGTLNYLVNNTDKLDLLVQEMRKRFRRRNDITLAALRDLPYLDAVLKEGLRLCPPVPWIVGRLVPPGGDTVAGVWLPGGTHVSFQAYSTNRDPSNFHLASTFLPERWISEATTDPKSPFFKDKRDAVQPFSLGPRSCLGQPLAWAEMRLILSTLVWAFDFAVVPEKRVRWEELRTFLFFEKKPIVVSFKLRDDSE